MALTTEVIFNFSNDDQMLPFTFDLPQSHLVIVSNSSSLFLLKNSLEDALLLGIDTETQPSFIKKSSYNSRNGIDSNTKLHPTSLIQMAVRAINGKEMVFILDLLELNKLHLLSATSSTSFGSNGSSSDKGFGKDYLYENQKINSHRRVVTLDEVLIGPLTNPNIVKIGQGLARDFKELYEAYPKVMAFKYIRSILDTSTFISHLKPEIKRIFSLRHLVKVFLNFNLFKSFQMSNWGKRPLSEGQIHYAACDALVLLRLYDAFQWTLEDVLQENETRINGDSDQAAVIDYYDAAAIEDNTDSSSEDSVFLQDRNIENSERNCNIDAGFVGNEVSPSIKKLLKDADSTFISNRKRKRVSATLVSESASSVGSHLKGWRSEAAKDWYQTYLSASATSKITSHISISPSADSLTSCESGNSSQGNSCTLESSAKRITEVVVDDRIPLPISTGKHTYFDKVVDVDGLERAKRRRSSNARLIGQRDL